MPTSGEALTFRRRHAARPKFRRRSVWAVRTKSSTARAGQLHRAADAATYQLFISRQSRNAPRFPSLVHHCPSGRVLYQPRAIEPCDARAGRPSTLDQVREAERRAQKMTVVRDSGDYGFAFATVWVDGVKTVDLDPGEVVALYLPKGAHVMNAGLNARGAAVGPTVPVTVPSATTNYRIFQGQFLLPIE